MNGTTAVPPTPDPQFSNSRRSGRRSTEVFFGPIVGEGSAAAAIVHIGPHKTGTTTIQRFLSSAMDPLSEGGFAIPPAGLVDGSASAAVNVAALAMMGCEEHPWSGWKIDPSRPNRLESWLSNSKGTPVLSAEEFSRFDGKAVATLSAMLPFGGTCLMGLRAYDSLSRSVWAQLLRAGVESRSLGNFQLDMVHKLISDPPPVAVDRSRPDLSRFRATYLAAVWQVCFPVRAFLVPEPYGPHKGYGLISRFLAAVPTSREVANNAIRHFRSIGAPVVVNRRPSVQVASQLLQLNRNVGTRNPKIWAAQRTAIERTTNFESQVVVTENDLAPNLDAERELRCLFASDASELGIALKT